MRKVSILKVEFCSFQELLSFINESNPSEESDASNRLLNLLTHNSIDLFDFHEVIDISTNLDIFLSNLTPLSLIIISKFGKSNPLVFYEIQHEIFQKIEENFFLSNNLINQNSLSPANHNLAQRSEKTKQVYAISKFFSRFYKNSTKISYDFSSIFKHLVDLFLVEEFDEKDQNSIHEIILEAIESLLSAIDHNSIPFFHSFLQENLNSNDKMQETNAEHYQNPEPQNFNLNRYDHNAIDFSARPYLNDGNIGQDMNQSPLNDQGGKNILQRPNIQQQNIQSNPLSEIANNGIPEEYTENHHHLQMKEEKNAAIIKDEPCQRKEFPNDQTGKRNQPQEEMKRHRHRKHKRDTAKHNDNTDTKEKSPLISTKAEVPNHNEHKHHHSHNHYKKQKKDTPKEKEDKKKDASVSIDKDSKSMPELSSGTQREIKDAGNIDTLIRKYRFENSELMAEIEIKSRPRKRHHQERVSNKEDVKTDKDDEFETDLQKRVAALEKITKEQQQKIQKIDSLLKKEIGDYTNSFSSPTKQVKDEDKVRRWLAPQLPAFTKMRKFNFVGDENLKQGEEYVIYVPPKGFGTQILPSPIVHKSLFGLTARKFVICAANFGNIGEGGKRTKDPSSSTIVKMNEKGFDSLKFLKDGIECFFIGAGNRVRPIANIEL